MQHQGARGEQAVGHGTIVGMAVLIDEPIWPFRGELWCHLVSDVSYDELHEVAQALGIPRRGFQGDHYDVPARFRDQAIALGAQPVTGRELITRLRDSGLRRATADDRSDVAGLRRRERLRPTSTAAAQCAMIVSARRSAAARARH